MVGELVITQAMLAQQLLDQSGGQRQQWIRGSEELAAHTRELQECVMAIRMQPVRSVFARMPRLVRDVSARLGKKVKLITAGDQTEVDKTVIEELSDPITHMIRNAIDHGVENEGARLAAGKSSVATIELSAAQRAGNILITISDDGAGIDRQKVLQSAIAKGIVREDAKLSDDEIHNLIFAPGFTTAEKVTEVSGRGVGMDVVRRNISNLGGRIQIQSTPGKGTRFTLVIPLTLAVLDGMLVAVGKEKYILPLASIVGTIRPEKRQVRNVAGGAQVVAVRGEFIRVIPIHRILNVPEAMTDPTRALLVVIETENGSKAGLVVDELIGQQQVVVKSLAENSEPVPGISGATILGNGRVALILDLEGICAMTERPAPAESDETLTAHAGEAELHLMQPQLAADALKAAGSPTVYASGPMTLQTETAMNAALAAQQASAASAAIGAPTAGGMKQYISFKIGGEEYAIDIMAVREIKGWTETTSLPNQAQHILGVMNLRGHHRARVRSALPLRHGADRGHPLACRHHRGGAGSDRRPARGRGLRHPYHRQFRDPPRPGNGPRRRHRFSFRASSPSTTPWS